MYKHSVILKINTVVDISSYRVSSYFLLVLAKVGYSIEVDSYVEMIVLSDYK